MRRRSSLRRLLSLAYANAGLWGLGSGLASLTLVLYWARGLGASGTVIGWIIAAPSIAGLLRLGTPAWLSRVGSPRRFCVAMFWASSAALGALPLVARPGLLPGAGWSTLAVGLAWTAYQLLESIAVVALWSWYGAIVPPRVRGRFVGRREAWMTAGLVAGSLAAAGGVWLWQRQVEAAGQPELAWRAYAACGSFGAALVALAVLPLVRMADASLPASNRGVRLGDLVRPLADRQFRRLMLFGAGFSLANGIVQSPRQVYLASVLRIELAEKRLLDGASRGLQAIVMPWLGGVADRRGHVPVLVVSWTAVTAATAFLLLARPGAKWWILGAYACWVAYAGVNVTLPSLMLGLSPPDERPAYAAAWFAWTQLAYAASVVLGGVLLDRLGERLGAEPLSGRRFDRFALMFMIGGALMAAGIVLAARIREPRRARTPGG